MVICCKSPRGARLPELLAGREPVRAEHSPTAYGSVMASGRFQARDYGKRAMRKRNGSMALKKADSQLLALGNVPSGNRRPMT